MDNTICKRLILILVFLLMASAFTVAEPSGDADSCANYTDGSSRIMGDITGDGVFNSTDALAMARLASNPENICCVDIDLDGTFTPTDYELAYNVSIGQYSWIAPYGMGTCDAPIIPAKESGDYYYCSNNSVRGDITADGVANNLDASIVYNMALGNVPLPTNICCIDIDLSNSVTTLDAFTMQAVAVGNYTADMGACNAPVIPTARYCADYADGQSRLQGDATGDGIVDNADATLISNMVSGNVPIDPGNICCLDVDSDDVVTETDYRLVSQINVGNYTPAGTCAVPKMPQPKECTDYPNGDSRLRGDANGDGIVDNADAQLILNMELGNVPVYQDACCIDIDMDGEINDYKNDSTLVSEYNIGNFTDAGTCASPKIPQSKGNTMFYYCSANSLRGDITADGIVNNLDASVIGGMADGLLGVPLNFCCVDIDFSNSVTMYDANVVYASAVGNYTADMGACNAPVIPTARYCADYANGDSRLRGDANGDGIVDNADVSMILDMALGTVPTPPNLCCVDLTLDNNVTSADSTVLEEISAGNYSSAGTCAEPLIPEQNLFCGDNICNNGESCAACSADCGTCPEPPSNEDEGDINTVPRSSGGGVTTNSDLDVSSREVLVNEEFTITVLCGDMSGCELVVDGETLDVMLKNLYEQEYNYSFDSPGDKVIELFRTRSGGNILEKSIVISVVESETSPEAESETSPEAEPLLQDEIPLEDNNSSIGETLSEENNQIPTGFLGLLPFDLNFSIPPIEGLGIGFGLVFLLIVLVAVLLTGLGYFFTKYLSAKKPEQSPEKRKPVAKKKST